MLLDLSNIAAEINSMNSSLLDASSKNSELLANQTSLSHQIDTNTEMIAYLLGVLSGGTGAIPPAGITTGVSIA